MSRRRRNNHEEPQNHERWLVSYADFITLMFAFFVVMYASSQADKQKTKQLSESIEQALQQGQIGTRIDQLLSGKKHHSMAAATPPQMQKAATLEAPLAELRKSLEKEIREGQLDVRLEGRGLVVSLKQAAFFPSGDAVFAASGYAAIAKVVATLERIPNSVRLEGHTDAIPIRNGRFSSNWELSSARSIAMLNLLTEKHKFPASRLAVVGYADTVPVDTNDTDEGRARNRRVDITILNDTAVGKEPSASPAPKSVGH